MFSSPETGLTQGEITVQLTWLGAAGFRLETVEGAVILLDPFLSRPAEAKPALPLHPADLRPVDEILLTQGRFDHAMDVPGLVEQTGAIVHAAEAVCRNLINHGLSANRLQPISPHHAKRIGSLRWYALRGQANQVDSSPSLRARLRNEALYQHIQPLEHAWPLGGVMAYLLESDELTVMHFGSAGWEEAGLSGLTPDILLLPVERPAQPDDNVIRLASLLQPAIIVPHHWDNYYPPLSEQVDLTPLTHILQTELPHTKIYRPMIGERFNLIDLF